MLNFYGWSCEDLINLIFSFKGDFFNLIIYLFKNIYNGYNTAIKYKKIIVMVWVRECDSRGCNLLFFKGILEVIQRVLHSGLYVLWGKGGTAQCSRGRLQIKSTSVILESVINGCSKYIAKSWRDHQQVWGTFGCLGIYSNWKNWFSWDICYTSETRDVSLFVNRSSSKRLGKTSNGRPLCIFARSWMRKFNIVTIQVLLYWDCMQSKHIIVWVMTSFTN